MKKISIVIVEDDPGIKDFVSINFSKDDFYLKLFEDAETALNYVEINIPDIIILDWMLPNISGISFARTLKKKKETKNIPIIMLTARSDEKDKLNGFKIGVDDYVTKPFSPKELKARIKVILKRTNPSLYSESLVYLDLEINLITHTVKRGNIKLKLSPREFKLLQNLMEHPLQVFSREQLLDKVWGRDSDIEFRTVDVHIRRLRKSINLKNLKPLIKTVRSIGYSLT